MCALVERGLGVAMAMLGTGVLRAVFFFPWSLVPVTGGGEFGRFVVGGLELRAQFDSTGPDLRI